MKSSDRTLKRMVVNQLMVVLSCLMIVVLPAGAMSEKDSSAATIYFQSMAQPALVTHCSEVWPQLEGVFSIALARWQDSNKKIVKRGEKVTAKQLSLKGKALKKKMEQEAKSILAESKSQSSKQQQQQCAVILETLISEI
ncbi:hypothetical protein [Marinicella marina]|nr:hypothetical protein [Marinicella marina]